MNRFVLEDVTLIKTEEITVPVRFKGGANKALALHEGILNKKGGGFKEGNIITYS